jgi:uncharacterized coiled-coil protein SlyX
MNVEDRLTQMETHIAHLEKTIDELNEVIVEHTKALKTLGHQQQRIARTIENYETEKIRENNTKPPHHEV